MLKFFTVMVAGAGFAMFFYWEGGLFLLSWSLVLFLSSPVVGDWGEGGLGGFSFSSLSFLMVGLTIVTLFWATSYLATVEVGTSSSLLIFYLLVLALALFMFFVSDKILKIYVSFELSVLPIFMIIMGWGYQSERLGASLSLLFYTLTASMPLLVSFMWLSTVFSHASVCSIFFQGGEISGAAGWVFSLAGFLAFAVKLPVFGVHLWLPKAHVEAPVVGSMILAAILLKLGSYGLWLFLPVYFYSGFIMIWSSTALIGALLVSLLCLRLTDLKMIIAYSSVGHMGIMVVSLLTATKLGVGGAIFLMIAHGASSSSMFMMVFLLYRANHSRSMLLTKGILAWCGTVPLFWFLILMANMASPPTFNLLAEVMVITSVVLAGKSNMVLMILIIMASTGYSLIMYSSTVQGLTLTSSSLKLITPSELLIFLNHLSWVFLMVFGLGVLN